MEEINWPICRECTAVQKTCCNSNLKGPLTVSDIKRISALGFDPKEFIVAGEYPEDWLAEDEDWWKNNVIQVGNKWFKTNTKKKGNGDECFFLKEGKGCVLGTNRPLACRIHPFWLDKQNRLIYSPGERDVCYFIKKGIAISESLKMVGETEESIRRYFAEIKKDCLENREVHRKIIIETVKESCIHLLDTAKN